MHVCVSDSEGEEKRKNRVKKDEETTITTTNTTIKWFQEKVGPCQSSFLLALQYSQMFFCSVVRNLPKTDTF